VFIIVQTTNSNTVLYASGVNQCVFQDNKRDGTKTDEWWANRNSRLDSTRQMKCSYSKGNHMLINNPEDKKNRTLDESCEKSN